MASVSEVLGVLQMMVDANLSFPPNRDRLDATARVWARLLEDIPCDILERAALDLIIEKPEFPKINELRAAAKDVKWRNGKSAVGNPFEAPFVRQRKEYAMLPDAYRAEHDRLKAKYSDSSGLPTDDELYHLEELSGRIE